MGEYGENTSRPHYHLALFGADFREDRTYHYTSDSGHKVYRSKLLEKAWDLGNSEVGELTLESAQYVASYIMKKQNGIKAAEHYRRTDEAGVDYWLTPEFALMSRGGRKGRGIAAEWLKQYTPDVYTTDQVIHKGKRNKPPRYYDKLLERIDPTKLALVKMQRAKRAQELAGDNTPARLADKEICQNARMALKKRKL